MNKLSFEQLANKANSIASDELLNTIAGGLKGKSSLSSCHSDSCHKGSAY